MSSDYWLGLATIPAAAASLALIVRLLFAAGNFLAKRGITFGAKWHRNIDGISEYTLRRDIWWERSFGPIFIGGWYHKQLIYGQPTRARFNRWVGVGRPDGPCLMVYHSRDLGPI
jgi:hypothetical protein